MKFIFRKSANQIKNWTNSIATPFSLQINPTPSVTVSNLRLPKVAVTQVSVRGLRHAERQQALQDSGSVTSSKNGRFIIQVLCDGISSQEFADEGAHFFSRAIGSELAFALEQVSIDQIKWNQFAQLLSHQFRLDHLPHEMTRQFQYPADFEAAKDIAIPGESLFGTTAEILVIDILQMKFTRIRLSGDGGLFTSVARRRFDEIELTPHADLTENQVERLPNWKIRSQIQNGDLSPNWLLLFCTDGFADAMRTSQKLQRLIFSVPKDAQTTLNVIEKIASEAARHSDDDLSFGIAWNLQ
jgi:serine/threonine protein phosphatase PrpC